MQTVEYRVLHSGHVEKQRVNAKLLNTKKWRRRYLELHPTTLVWFREGTEKKGYIFLNAETEVQEWPPTLGHAGAIMVRSPQDNRVLSFRCSSMDEHREWFHHISAVVEQAVQRSSAEGKKVTRRVSVSFAANGEVPGQRSSVRASRAVVDDNDSDDGSDEGGDEVGQSLGSEAEGRLLAVAGNSTCADCVTSDPAHFPNTPAWGSTNLGCVFCIRCSGVHRKLGAHVSKVLSLRPLRRRHHLRRHHLLHHFRRRRHHHHPAGALAAHRHVERGAAARHGGEGQRCGQRRAGGGGAEQRREARPGGVEHGGCSKMASALFEDGAPAARPVAPTAQAATTDPGAPPEPLGRLPWHPQPAWACATDGDFPLPIIRFHH